MRFAALFLAGASLTLTANPAFAAKKGQDQQPATTQTSTAQPVPTQSPASQKPITDKTVTAADVATTPVTDLNLKKTEIPPLLLAAIDRPYETAGLTSCARIGSAVADLDAVLGGDIDLPQADRDKITAGTVAKSVVASFIPFRGIIREISGANEQERRIQTAVYAGSVRRGFLKGLGQQRGCAYPARPAPASLVAAKMQALDAAKTAPVKAKSDTRRKTGKVRTVSRPVVQKVP